MKNFVKRSPVGIFHQFSGYRHLDKAGALDYLQPSIF